MKYLVFKSLVITSAILGIFGLTSMVYANEISIVPSTPLIGQEICKDGFSPPQCIAVQFDTSQDLAFQGNGLAKPAVAFDNIEDYATIHRPEFANDGYYGNGASWISNSPNSWIKIDLGKATLIDTVQFGRDRTGSHDDRDPGQFTISIALSDNIYANGDDSNDQNEYTQVFDSSAVGFSGIISDSQTVQAKFTPVTVRFIKMTVTNAGTDIDEIELFKAKNEGTNKSPTISSFTATPKAGNPPLTVNFAVQANDPDGSIASYQWDFDGDGITDDTTTTGETAHTYYDLGIFNANVSIIDNQNGTIKSNSIPINVQYGPDLIGKIVSYNFNDTTNTINIAFKVSNMGGVPANQFPVTFNLSNDGTTVLSNFKEITVGTLGIKKSKIIKLSYTFTGSIYDKYILIFIDPKKIIAEVDESNNGSRIVVQSMPTQ